MPICDTDCAASYKVLILGDSTVGKSALLNCLMGGAFKPNSLPTVGIDFIKKTFEVDGALVQLVIWDTAGQERFRSITRSQYRGVQGVVLAYDVTSLHSFSHLPYWIEIIDRSMSYGNNSLDSIPIVLIGNKVDRKEEDIKVKTFSGRKLMKQELLFDFFETSAQTGQNVFRAFHRLAYCITDICNPKLMKSYHHAMVKRDNSVLPRQISRDLKRDLKTRKQAIKQKRGCCHIL